LHYPDFGKDQGPAKQLQALGKTVLFNLQGGVSLGYEKVDSGE